jgi:hypothetical protein
MEDEMRDTQYAMGKIIKAYKISFVSPEGRSPLWGFGLDCRVLLK